MYPRILIWGPFLSGAPSFRGPPQKNVSRKQKFFGKCWRRGEVVVSAVSRPQFFRKFLNINTFQHSRPPSAQVGPPFLLFFTPYPPPPPVVPSTLCLKYVKANKYDCTNGPGRQDCFKPLMLVRRGIF